MAEDGKVVIKVILETGEALRAKAKLDAELKSVGKGAFKGFDDAAKDAEESAGKAGKAAKSAGDEAEKAGAKAKGAGEESEKAGKKAAEAWRDAAESAQEMGDKLTVVTGAAGAVGAAAFKSFTDWESATGRLQSQLGVTRDEAERLAEVGKGIYEDGWGESIQGVTDSLAYAKQQLEGLNDADLSKVTSACLMLDQQGSDYNETLRGARVLIEDFGMSADAAMDLLVSATQDGLNWTDELGDNISEYAPRWADAGVSAEDYFSLLKAGADNGAYSLDKVGDYLNEFLTSLSDGRMDDAMANFSQGTQDVFEAWKNGEATAKDVLDAVIGELRKMPSEYDRMQAASELWSSLGEDNCMSMIMALGDVQNAYGDTAGAAEQAMEDASQGWGELVSAGRKLMDSLEPIGGKLAEVVDGAADAAAEFADWFEGLDDGSQNAVIAIGGIMAAAGPLLSLGGRVAGGIGTIAEAFGGLKGSSKPLQDEAGKGKSAIDGLNGAFDTTPGKVALWAGALAGAAGIGYELSMSLVGANDALSRGRDQLDGNAQKAYEYADALGKVDENGDGIIDAQDAMAKALDVSEAVMERGPKIAASFGESVDEINSKASGIAGGLRDLYGATEDDVLRALDSITSETSIQWANAVAATKAGGEDLSDANKQAMEDMLQGLNSLPEKYKEQGTEALRALAAGMAAYYPELEGYADMSMEELSSAMREALGLGLANQDGVMADAGGSMVEELSRGLKAAASGGELDQAGLDTISAYMDSMRDSLDSGGEMSDMATQMMRDLASGLSEQWPELADCGNMTGGQIMDAIEARLSESYGDAYKATGDLASGLEEGSGGIEEQTLAIVGLFMSMGEGVSSAFSSVGVDMGEFAVKLAEAGVSTETLNAIGSENIAALAQSCNGNIDEMINRIVNYNGTDLLPKETTSEVRGNVPDGSAKSSIDGVNDATSRMQDKDVDVRVNTNAGSAATDIWNAVSAIGNLVNKHITAQVDVIRNKLTGNAKGGIRPHADGGIRMHGTGAVIARKAVPLDIVGEDGAEAIVPLTNRRYSQPFVDLIADGVEQRLKGLMGQYADLSVKGVRDMMLDMPQLKEAATYNDNRATTTNTKYVFSGDITIKADDARQAQDMGQLARAIMRKGALR